MLSNETTFSKAKSKIKVPKLDVCIFIIICVSLTINMNWHNVKMRKPVYKMTTLDCSTADHRELLERFAMFLASHFADSRIVSNGKAKCLIEYVLKITCKQF